ncbi:GNAT family N-acetyltransferase [Mesorhizobium sp. M1D.F.Ca.ET.043.01.1.1]|uniref:GNAT family N-acetyltransferase n=2 Tax=unclassified Mesorhizobium TaxID=325217 RepID=UPI00167886FF|nr:GNAT family N-acetyltransferase [Mesorhizobium sp. M1D.F.Ca.ET.043.01.1.1]
MTIISIATSASIRIRIKDGSLATINKLEDKILATPNLIESDKLDPAYVDAIRDGLRDYNQSKIGLPGGVPLVIAAEDPESGTIVGGLIGSTVHAVLYVEQLFIDDAHRGTGLGARVLAAGEEAARRRGCRTAVLWTATFQAPAFYERRGWEAFGEVECAPPGEKVIFLRRCL